MGSEHRQIARDSLFVLADLRVNDADAEHRVKVRNLSAGGMMAEGTVKVQTGDAISVNIRNIGWVDGAVAWVHENRFGIALHEEIDPKLARMPVVPGEGSPRFTKTPLPQEERGRVRKI